MSVFHQVVEFNRDIIGIQPRTKGMLYLEELKFTAKALNEEQIELVEAHNGGDFIGCVDALLDSIYFAIGALYKMGLTPEQMERCMTAVHEANMTKKKGMTKRGHENDAVKPETWIPPEERIGQILEE